jgi:hypothetical protein
MSQIENAIIVSPLDEKMEQSLAKVNVTNLVIDTLKAKYSDLKLRHLEDKEMYIEIKQAVKDCAKVRNAATKACKEGREEAVRVQKQWIAKEKEVLGKIAEVESPLDAEIDRFDNHMKEVELAEQRRQEQQYMERTQALTKIGALYHDASFTLGSFTLDASLVKESSPNVWQDEILPKFIEEHLIIEGERVEKEKREAEARLKFEQEQAEFKRQQEEFEAKKREAERKVQIERSRLQNERFGRLIMYNPYGADVDMATLWALGDDQFEEILASKRAEYDRSQAERQKAIEQAAIKRERERIEEEERQAAIRKQQEEARKAEELAKSGDKAIWNHFIEQIAAIEMPVVKSGQYRKAANIAKDRIVDILNLKPY